ncbi:MAG TPA: hypothetical protein VGO58_11215 [Chitinophagaceae bacterium]|jgi:hypothetical protein|nr:hypothetical protein [Chitinophagaceae bacterium]
MKIKFSILAIAAGLFLSGYKANVTDDPPMTVAKKLVRTSIGKDQSISFNTDGTLQMISWIQAGSLCEKLFSYSPAKISYTLTIDGEKKEDGEYKLAGGRVVTLDWLSFDDPGKPSAHYLELFTYNAEGLLQKHSFNSSWSEYVYDDDQNLARASHFNSQGQPTTIVEYKYTSIKDLFPAINYFNKDGSGFFLPAFSKYLPSSKKVTKVSTGVVTLKGKFSYELDADGYVLAGRWDALSAGDPDLEWTNRFQ